PGAHSFSMSSNADGGLKVSTVFDFKSWQMVQRTLGLAHVPPDMHDSSITLLEGQVTTGRCESSDSNANIECVFNEPVTANLSTGWGLNGDRLFDFKILSFRKITNDTQKVLLEIQLASMDGTKSGKTQTWTYEKSNCSLDQ
ncbi:MAG: hypothetical protein NT027_16925, partial [Proteobacteria bacterium]|nr:hypothetical protein [Pseudomonadota bacterium]